MESVNVTAQVENNNNTTTSDHAHGNIDVTICTQLENFSFLSPSQTSTCANPENDVLQFGDYFPETDADAAIDSSADSIHSANLFSSPDVSTSDICSKSEHLSSSLPLNDFKGDKVDPHVLKTLLDFVLDACRKLHALYSDLDKKVDQNARFLNEKLSVIHLLHQTTFSESLKECRDERHELSVKIDQFSQTNDDLRTQWQTQMDLIRQNSETDGESSGSEDNTAITENSPFENSRFGNGVFQNLEAEVTRLNESVSKLSNELHDVDIRVIECEQYPRRNNIVISGIPDNVSHNHLKDKVLDICGAIGLQLNDEDISACHRLPKNRNVRWPAKTIIRFVNRENVDYCLSHRDRLKSRPVRNKLDGMNLRFFENLCKSNNDVLRMCKWLQENDHIHAYFLRNGFVKIVVIDGGYPEKIPHPKVLQDRFPEIPQEF